MITDTTTPTPDKTPTPDPVTIDLPAECSSARSESDRRSWHHRIVLRPDAREVTVISAYGDGVPVPLWRGLWVRLGEIADGTADTTKIADTLAAHADDLARLCEWHESEWDGRNHVGRWTDERAREILQAICDDVAAACREAPAYWDADEWLAHTSDDELFPRGVSGTADAIDALVAELLHCARGDDVHLREADLYDVIESRWEQAAAKRADDAEDEGEDAEGAE